MSVKITFLGHAGFVFDDGQHRVAVDPFLTDNPVAVHLPTEIEVDYIALTHGHWDHVGDTVAIAMTNDAPVIAVPELCSYIEEQGHEKTEPGNPGGRIHTAFGDVFFTPAFHSSSYDGRYMGMPTGMVFRFSDPDITIYHTGDTALFSDMRLIGQLARPDVMCVCIGDRFTMGPHLASLAAEYVGPQYAIPMHYKTWPLLVDSADEFKPNGVTVREMEPGEMWEVG